MTTPLPASFSALLVQMPEDPTVHARLCNSFSLLEYIGARKILKSQTEAAFDFSLLLHVGEEIQHAQILKAAARRLAPGSCETYASTECLAPGATHTYIQSVDQGAFQLAQGSHHGSPIYLAYLLTTLMLEVRAAEIYPHWDAFYGTKRQDDSSPLRSFAPFIHLGRIASDEERHLRQVKQKLGKMVSDSQLAELHQQENHYFAAFLEALGAEAQSSHLGLRRSLQGGEASGETENTGFIVA